MKTLNKQLLFIGALLIFYGNVWSYSASIPAAFTAQDEAVEIAKSLSSHGILEQAQDGYVYLKVPDEYVHRLFPFIKEPGFTVPSAIQRHSKIGAHISVFYKNESKLIGLVKEINDKYSFVPEKINIVRSGRKEYIILEVKSPELEQLRESYGLSPKLLNHEFHITLAEKHISHHSKSIKPVNQSTQ